MCHGFSFGGAVAKRRGWKLRGTVAAERSRETNPGRVFAFGQRLSRSLMFPVSVIPIAALLVRLGAPDMLGAEGLGRDLPVLRDFAGFLAAAGGAVMENLPLLFAVGVCIGFARKATGMTALAAVVGYLVFSGVITYMAPAMEAAVPGDAQVDYGILGGMIVGWLCAWLWRIGHRVRFPSGIDFFSGPRFVPVVSALASAALGALAVAVFPVIDRIINVWLAGLLLHSGNTVLSGFLFGTAQRLLVPLGLHHLLNTVPWFTLGSCVSADGVRLQGDMPCFFSGVEGSFAPEGFVPGTYLGGLYPILLGGLLGAALAMYLRSERQNRRTTGTLMLSGALGSFFVGVTEPLEFAFAYISPPLFAVHAFLTGSAFAVVNGLGIRDGFAFSAGLIDFAVNFTRSAQLSVRGATGPLLILALAAAYFVIYFLVFYWGIKFFNAATPGRKTQDI
ncbi:MAG: PTS transporter subunit EIIC [Varibaculum sp.]|nr:PTS transporter subunit EIIC [Varibaculum sp.]